MEKNQQILSIVTPTFNRSRLLQECYHSLCRQQVFNFEWIVVDDGSTDDTKEVMGRILENRNAFPIYYIQKENGGKHTALNASHPYIHGKYVLILDSDDKLTEDASISVQNEWKKYEECKEIGLLIFLKENTQHQLCAYARDEYKPVDLLNYKRVEVVSSDCCEVLRSDLFLKYPFPVFEGEKFLAETALWYRVGLEVKCIYVNKVIYICEYLVGGLSQSGKAMRIRNPKGGKYTSYLRMNRRCRLEERVKAGMLFICYGYFAGDKGLQLFAETKPYRLLTAFCFMPGRLIYSIWRKKYTK